MLTTTHQDGDLDLLLEGPDYGIRRLVSELKKYLKGYVLE